MSGALSPDPGSFDVPDAVEPLVGWRYWRLGADGALRSLTGLQPVWPAGEPMKAECRFHRADPDDWRYRMVTAYDTRPHWTPGEGCTCGIYAALDLRHLRSQALFGLRRTIVGEVALWGKVIPAQHGYRAERAYPRKLCVPEHVAERDPGAVLALAAYRVAVEVVEGRVLSYSPLAAAGRHARRLSRR